MQHYWNLWNPCLLVTLTIGVWSIKQGLSFVVYSYVQISPRVFSALRMKNLQAHEPNPLEARKTATNLHKNMGTKPEVAKQTHIAHHIESDFLSSTIILNGPRLKFDAHCYKPTLWTTSQNFEGWEANKRPILEDHQWLIRSAENELEGIQQSWRHRGSCNGGKLWARAVN